jgi:hypothetical protein
MRSFGTPAVLGIRWTERAKLPVAPSAIGIKGQQHFTSQGLKDYETPQELTAG